MPGQLATSEGDEGQGFIRHDAQEEVRFGGLADQAASRAQGLIRARVAFISASASRRFFNVKTTANGLNLNAIPKAARARHQPTDMWAL
jgi:hypothetical protein